MTNENKYRYEEEEDGKPYESNKNWFEEISHLKWPVIIIGILVLILLILIDVNLI